MKTQKHIIPWLLAAFCLIAVTMLHPSLSHAADASPPAATVPAVGTGSSTVDVIMNLVTPVLATLAIAVVKKVSPSIPSWVLPLLAPILGVLIAYLSSLATGGSVNVVLAAGLGALGVFLREVTDQLKKSPLNPANASPTG